MGAAKKIKRPDWWRPGMPLPALSALVTHTGQGKINRMKEFGGATSTLTPVVWETIAEWHERTGGLT